MDIRLYQGDLPDAVAFGKVVAIDTETMGLNTHRDRLCLVQMTFGDGVIHLVQFQNRTYHAPNLQRLLADPGILKIFHFGRFDIAMLYAHLGVLTQNVYCTKIASRLVRTFTDRHGLKELCRELLGVDISKTEQRSDWGASTLTPEQLKYAAGDVLYLHQLRDQFNIVLEREGRRDLAQKCFDFLPTRALLDHVGWPEQDIFAY
jgi:ribonuclease D